MRTAILDCFIHHLGKTWWAPTVLRTIGPFVHEEEKVLDIGAGGGWIGELLSEKKKVKVQLLDVEDFNRSRLALKLYDGERIPFPDNSFDSSLLLFVLHHCKDPFVVLKEAIRVTKKRLIIYEDTYTSSFKRALVCANDFISNSPLFLANPFKMNMPYNYRKVADWETAFQELGLKVRFTQTTRHFMTTHVLFVLEK